MTNYVQAIVYLVPNAKITYKGNNIPYSKITWLDERTQPTKEECDAVFPEVEYQAIYKKVEHKRQSRYVSETDGIFFDLMRSGNDLSSWITAVEAIKAALPYPNQPTA